MDKKTYAIGVLALTGAILFVAQFLPLGSVSVRADTAVRDPATEIQMVTARNLQGGDSLYIIARDGRLVVLQYDPVARGLKVKAAQSLVDIMTRAGGR